MAPVSRSSSNSKSSYNIKVFQLIPGFQEIHIFQIIHVFQTIQSSSNHVFHKIHVFQENPRLPEKSMSSMTFKDFQLIHTFRKNLCLLPNPSLPINPGLPANLHLLEKSRSSIQSTSSRKIYIFQSIHVF